MGCMSNESVRSYSSHSEHDCMATCSNLNGCEVATFSPGNASLGKSGVCRTSPDCKGLSLNEEHLKLFIKGQTRCACVDAVCERVEVAIMHSCLHCICVRVVRK